MASHGHLAHGVLQILVNLQGDGQDLGIASLLRTKTLEGVENPIFFIAFVIVKGIINYAVSFFVPAVLVYCFDSITTACLELFLTRSR